jgi:hypothetical protein
MTDTATNDPEVPAEPVDPLVAAEAAMLKATTRIKTLEQELRDCRDMRDEDQERLLKDIAALKAEGTVTGWKVFLESVLYAAWLVFTLFVTFVPLWQALIGKHHYPHLWGTFVGVISGWVFYHVIRDRSTLR